ncbi:MAG: 3-dehydroquinate synthase [Candidatus Omnitrophica bacterium]|nr:3-dehydroquinate synthase [Candidatus Omnitrophota bacterium]
MKIIKLKLKKQPYNIVIGSRIFPLLSKFLLEARIGDYAYVITNPAIKKHYGARLHHVLRKAGIGVRFKVVADSERSKSLDCLKEVVRDMVGFEKGKRMFVIAFGGGVIGDLSGFVASVYKRGIPYVQVPTTLLAQVDSAIGGKTAVDLQEGKNLIGAFYQPRLVFSDTELLDTLQLRQKRCGMAEVIKYAIIKDADFFGYLEKNCLRALAGDRKTLESIIYRCSRIKAGIVEKDEREEKGIRTILNFGHTIGHAIEAAAGYRGYNHGEAISLGMLVACDISKSLSLLSGSAAKRIERLIEAAGLPQKISGVKPRDIITAHYRDKKFIGAKNRLVLLKDIGRTKITEDIPLATIKKALIYRF